MAPRLLEMDLEDSRAWQPPFFLTWLVAPFSKQYHRIPGASDSFHAQRRSQKTPLWRRCVLYVCWSLLALFCLWFYLILAQLSGWFPYRATVSRTQWHNPEPTIVDATIQAPAQPSTTSIIEGCRARQEWRTLSKEQQHSYIDAVLCLRDQPSHWADQKERTAYDDFPYVHSHEGYYTHNSAPFLPWHRYFLHIYETTLSEKCGYDGGLVYWDWTLDSEALEKSPVFDAESGFGGDGEVGGASTVGRTGRCVVDGRFANIQINYFDVKLQPHCLSRGFRDQEGNLGHIDGHDISPLSINEVLSIDKYEEFVALMESRVHDAIPFGIGGDFETFTAPYDPIFFLHHTQLDRLWWLWQQRENGSRFNEYGGHKQRHSMEMASLNDEINMRGLAPAIKVSETMDTETGLLCYRY